VGLKSLKSLNLTNVYPNNNNNNNNNNKKNNKVKSKPLELRSRVKTGNGGQKNGRYTGATGVGIYRCINTNCRANVTRYFFKCYNGWLASLASNIYKNVIAKLFDAKSSL
jgi:hypothetical protein